MQKGCILWLTGVLPNLNNLGLTSREANELSNIMFEGLNHRLYEAISDQRELSITQEPPCSLRDGIFAFKNGCRNFLVVSNPNFSDSDLESVLRKETETIIIFLRKPKASRKSFIRIAAEYNVPFVTQRIPAIEWSPKFEHLNEEIDHDFRRIINNQSPSETDVLNTSFLQHIKGNNILKVVFEYIKKHQHLFNFIIQLIIECSKGGCQYIAGICGL